jgi:hypothetical protein
MARNKNAIMVADPHLGDLLTLTELAERYQIGKTTLSVRYRDGKRGLDLIKAPNTRRQTEQKQQSAARAATIQERAAVIGELVSSRVGRCLSAPRLADLGRVASASKGAAA